MSRSAPWLLLAALVSSPMLACEHSGGSDDGLDPGVELDAARPFTAETGPTLIPAPQRPDSTFEPSMLPGDGAIPTPGPFECPGGAPTGKANLTFVAQPSATSCFDAGTVTRELYDFDDPGPVFAPCQVHLITSPNACEFRFGDMCFYDETYTRELIVWKNQDGSLSGTRTFSIRGDTTCETRYTVTGTPL